MQETGSQQTKLIRAGSSDIVFPLEVVCFQVMFAVLHQASVLQQHTIYTFAFNLDLA
jgi:hypothetical protein